MTLRFTIVAVDLFEREVRLRLPFRFGAVTLREAPQAFVRARVRLDDGREGEGWSAELMVPKWFDKNPALSNEQNFYQLRRSLALARRHALAAPLDTSFGRHANAAAAIRAEADAAGLNDLVAAFGPALVDRAALDAALRLVGTSVFDAVRTNLVGLDARLTPDLAGFDIGAFLATLRPATTIRARHTVGMADALTDAEVTERIGDGLPESLEAAIAAYDLSAFKLKVGGDVAADLDRLARIAAVLDRGPAYIATLDGNEQYAPEGIVELWRRMGEVPALARLVASIRFVEQPVHRDRTFAEPIDALARLVPVEIDEAGGALDAFPRARALGYTGISTKACKGLFASLLNRARVAMWNAEEGAARFFMSAEDLTTQAGLAVQQDLAIATLVGCDHVERNGHHYAGGFAGAPEREARAFLAAHPDLYADAGGPVRLAIRDGAIALGSLAGPGFASGALPDASAMRAMPTPGEHEEMR